MEQVSSFYECSALVSCIEIAELFLTGSSDRVCYSAAIGGRTWVLMTSVEEGATSVRPRRGPPQESPVDTARSHEGLEINDAASSAAVAPSGFANAPAHAVDDSRFLRPPAGLRIRSGGSLHKTRILTLLQNAKREADVDARRDRTASSQKQHEGPLTAHPIPLRADNRIAAAAT